jgi:HSP20 family molecular chaperone IbpA
MLLLIGVWIFFMRLQIIRLPLLAPAIAVLALAPATSATRCRAGCDNHQRHLMNQARHGQHHHHRHHEQQLLNAVLDHFFREPSQPKTAEKNDKPTNPSHPTTTSTDPPAANVSSLTVVSPAFRTLANGHNYYLELEMPGVGAENLNLQVDSGDAESRNHRILSVTGQRSSSGANVVQFEERFLMPQDVEEASITATAADGLVTVTMPKKPEEPPTRIPVTNAHSSADYGGDTAESEAEPQAEPHAEPQAESASESDAAIPETDAASEQQIMGLLATPPVPVAAPATSTSSEDTDIDDVVTLLTEIKNSLNLQGTDTASEANWDTLISKLKSQAAGM